MTAPEFADKASRLLRGHLETQQPAVVSSAARDNAIVALRAAIAEKARRDRLKKRGIAAASLLLVAAAAVGIWVVRPKPAVTTPVALANVQDLHGSAEIRSTAGSGHLTMGSTLPEGATLSVSPDSEARFAYGSGTAVVVRDGAQITLVEQGEAKVFSLASGSFSAKVAKLHERERFVVRTSDAEIEVRGTAFTVSVVPPQASCGNGTPTRLVVTEGVVVVRNGGQETRVPAGSSWPQCDAVPAAIALTPNPTTSAVRAVNPKTPHSTLAAQNDLFQEAMARKRSGDGNGAVALFDQLAASYPGGVHAEDALAEKMRILRTRRLAEDYLRRYPNGYAKKEADTILGK